MYPLYPLYPLFTQYPLCTHTSACITVPRGIHIVSVHHCALLPKHTYKLRIQNITCAYGTGGAEAPVICKQKPDIYRCIRSGCDKLDFYAEILIIYWNRVQYMLHIIVQVSKCNSAERACQARVQCSRRLAKTTVRRIKNLRNNTLHLPSDCQTPYRILCYQMFCRAPESGFSR